MDAAPSSLNGSLTLADRTLGWHLTLGDLAAQHGPHCHGYQNACLCVDCRERAEHVAERPSVRQPWEQAA